MALLEWRNCKLYNILLCGVLSVIERFMYVIVYIESTLKLGAERRACDLFHSFLLLFPLHQHRLNFLSV